MRNSGSNIRGMGFVEPHAPQPECGRASQRRGIRHGGMPCPEPDIAAPDGVARKYLDAIPHAKDPMRKALLHEKAAACLLRAGEVAKSLHYAKEAHTLFREIDNREADEFRCRFAVQLSNSGNTVSTDFFNS